MTLCTPVTEWTARWATGPDTGATTVVPVGRHVVGRTGGIRTTAQGAAGHHVVLELGPDGSARALHLAPGADVHREGGTVVVTIGEARLDVRPGGTLATATAPAPVQTDAAVVLPDGSLVRRPRVVPTWTATETATPEPPAAHEPVSGGLAPTLLGLVGAALMATLLHQPMFLAFGAIGALVAAGSWAAQRVAGRRRQRRERRRYEEACAAFEAAAQLAAAEHREFVRARVPSTAAAVRAALPGPGAALWARRPAHGDAFVLGVGDHVEHGLPVEASADAGARIAVHGHGAHEVALGLVAQTVTSAGPADLRVVVVTEHPDRWDCLEGLPHLTAPSGERAVVRPDDLAALLEEFGDERHVLVVTDDLPGLAVRTGAVRRSLRDRHALIAVGGPDAAVPQWCTAALHVDTRAGETVGEWHGDTRTGSPAVLVRPGVLSEGDARHLAAALGALRDPEDDTAGRVPTEVCLESLVGRWDAARVCSQWAGATGDGHSRPRATIGVAADGTVDVDLVRDGPHALLAGTTGAGKSELLRTLVVGLAAGSPPDELQMVLVDYKGGATFDALDRLPHVAAVVSDLDEHLADRALRSLHAELRRRERLLREHHVDDLSRLDRRATTDVPPRLVVIVDEFAALVAEQPAFLHSLVGVAQRGRSLGVHLLLATQRPAGIVSDDIRANTNLRIALRVHDVADALDVVGDRLPAGLPRRIPGRGVIRLGADELLQFQTARLTDVDGAVTAICDAAERHGASAAPAPWLPPLPAVLRPSDVPDDAVGWCDDPDAQRRVPLQWDGGPVLVIGSQGSGVSTALSLLVGRALTDGATRAFVLTAGADGLPAADPRAVVVPVHDTGRVLQLLHRLGTPDGHTRTVLAVDGVDEVRRALDDPATADELDALDRALADPAITPLLGCAHPVRLPAGPLGRCGRRWVLHLHDPADAAMVGVPATHVPVASPGRVWVQELGLEAQLVLPSTGLRSVDGRRHARTRQDGCAIEPVPASVTDTCLPRGARADGELVLPLGLGLRTGRPVPLVLPEGDHVLVLGGPGSGRSTALAMLATAWRAACPEGRVVAVLPRRSRVDRSLADSVHRSLHAALNEVPPEGGPATLLLVDDAELTDDPTGALAEMIASRRADLTVVAAARGEALRQRYGHWTAPLRAGRIGLVATATAYEDGDLLGAVLPRRAPLPARPGLMWLAHHDGTDLVQVAAPTRPVGAATATCAVASGR